MPIPARRKDEDKDAFVSRCMADPVMNKDYPDSKQRAAICYRQSGEKKSKPAEAVGGDEGKVDLLVVPQTRKGGDPVPLKVNEAAKAKAMSLISEGKVDHKSPWAWDEAEAKAVLGNGKEEGMEAFSTVHLAIDENEKEDSRDRYKHPMARMRPEGIMLSREGVAKVRKDCATMSDKECEMAASEIMDAMDKKQNARADHASDPVEEELAKQREGRQRADSQAHPMEIRAGLSIQAAPVGQDDGEHKQEAPGPPRFEMVANTGKVPMRLAGWKHPVVMDLSGMNITSQSRPIRLHHDASQGVGHTDFIGIKDGQLVARGVVSRHTPAAQDVIASGKNGFPWQASVGATAEEVEFVKSGDESPVNGYLLKGPANIVRKSTLGEISFVDIGGDDSTTAKVAAMGKDGIETTDDPAVAVAEWGQSVAQAEAEALRTHGIEAAAAKWIKHPAANLKAIKRIQGTAMAEGWNVAQAEAAIKDSLLATLRDGRPMPPGPNTGRMRGTEGPATPKVLEAALCMAFLGRDQWRAEEQSSKRQTIDEILAADRDFGEDVVQEAWQYRNYGLSGIIAEALQSAGVQVPRGARQLYDTILQNRHAVQAEGFSTVNLPGILGNVANKVLLLAFLNVEATYNIIAEQADFANFQIHTMFRLEHLGEFEKVGNDGELKSGNLAQDSFTNKLDTRGQILTLTRQNIINDDLNSFRTLIAQLARKARIAAEKALYGVVMEPTDVFYTTAKGNRLTSNPIGITGYAEAEAALTLMADAGGDPIYATPRFVLVPPALRYFADQMYVSAALAGITGTQLPTDNPFKGRLVAVSSPYLQMAVMAGSSDSTWYMLADPLMVAAFQMAYLDGRRAPTIETADAEFNVLGMQMRCYWDFGVAKLDGRGAIKSTK